MWSPWLICMRSNRSLNSRIAPSSSGGTVRPLSISDEIRCSSRPSASLLLSWVARSNCAPRPRTSAASCSSAPSEATFETTPRSETTACSSCLNAIGSPWADWPDAAS